MRIIAAIVLCIGLVGSSEIFGQKQRSPRSRYFDAELLLRDVQYLASDELEGRDAERPSIEKARVYLNRRFKESNLEMFGNSFRQDFTIRYKTLTITPVGANFIGRIAGRKYPDKYVVITAHYDHLGIRNGELFNGASDNASGTAALFALAQYFKRNRPDHSFLFVAFDAEEQWYQGSKHFIANLPVKRESILLNINLDMIAPNDKGELYVAGLTHHPQFRVAMETAQKRAKVKLLFGHDRRELEDDDWTPQSDHFIFHQEKIPWIYLAVENHKHYHKTTDDFEIIEPHFFVKSVETIIEATIALDKGLKK
jgi:Zn-dependent M28 family amino/carboxypeptidase